MMVKEINFLTIEGGVEELMNERDDIIERDLYSSTTPNKEKLMVLTKELGIEYESINNSFRGINGIIKYLEDTYYIRAHIRKLEIKEVDEITEHDQGLF